VNPEVRDMMLLSTRLRVWNPDVVVPPSELRCHGRRLMVLSLSASHASLHRSHSPIAIIWSVELPNYLWTCEGMPFAANGHLSMRCFGAHKSRTRRILHLMMLSGTTSCMAAARMNGCDPPAANGTESPEEDPG
jgi:hypothetical protein